MKYHMMYPSELAECIELDEESQKWIERLDLDWSDLVDVFHCDGATTAIAVISTIHYEHYDTHPDGALETVIKEIVLKNPSVFKDEVDFLAVEKESKKGERECQKHIGQ